jgi:uncharacterized protein YbbK (DUF523 family)
MRSACVPFFVVSRYFGGQIGERLRIVASAMTWDRCRQILPGLLIGLTAPRETVTFTEMLTKASGHSYDCTDKREAFRH